MLIARNREVGVDVECLPYRGPCLEIADRYFSTSEVDVLRNAPPSEQPSRFIEYWVLKEAFIKAQGKGLTIPLDAFSFHIEKSYGSHIHIQYARQFEGRPDGWQFSLETVGKQHLLATAIERNGEETLELTRHEWNPLAM